MKTFGVDNWAYDHFLDPIEIQQRNQSAKAIAGAAVDDVKKEPTKEPDRRPANPLFRLRNVILAPRAGSQPRRPNVC